VGARKLEPKTVSESDSGLVYFEDIEVGVTLRSDWYPIERDEVVEFARKWDPHPFHLDEAIARGTLFGGLAACAPHIFAISSRLSFGLTGGRLALVAGLGGDGLQLLAPVRVGDRVRLARRFTAARPSKSRPTAGVVSIEDTLESPGGQAVFRTSGSMLVARRPAV
jgi:acyl dehydratase